MLERFSIEIFPPKSVQASFALSHTISTLRDYGPSYISVTCGTGNGSPDLTRDTLSAVSARTNIPLAAHMTCAADDLKTISARADAHWAAGIRRAVAVRGDKGDASSVPVPSLVRLLADKGFEVMVGAYPETHPNAASSQACLDALKAKQDAGATAALTQFFFDADVFLRFRDRAVAAGITLDIVPGILPVTHWNGAQRMSQACGIQIAPDLAEGFARAQRENRSELMATVHATELCDRLIQNGVTDLHMYTMNSATPTTTILQTLLPNRARCTLARVA